MAAFSTATGQHIATAGGCHATAESMFVRALFPTGLERTFHCFGSLILSEMMKENHWMIYTPKPVSRKDNKNSIFFAKLVHQFFTMIPMPTEFH
jgi:hypothetical protein